MAKKMCKCAVCGQDFDRNSIQATKYSARRYAHETCFPNGELVPMETPPSADPDLKILNDYIVKIYGDKANHALIKKQIKRFHDELGYSYSGIYKSLVYFYEVNHNSIDKSNGGIGIVEYVYPKAYQYYRSIFIAQNKSESKSLIQQVKEYVFKPKRSSGTKNKVLDWGEEDEIN